MLRLVASLFALSLFFGACVAPARAAQPAKVTARAVAATDAQIDATIRAKLAKSKIGKDGFRFKVQHGIVTWEGHTDVIQHKGSATRMAKAAGATQVVNNIQVSAAAKARAAGNLKKASETGAPKRASVS